MREIKFRAWDNKKKIMIHQDYSDRLDKCLTYYELNESVELMQFTGLQDKNGVDVFEGDIIEVIASPENNHCAGFVFFTVIEFSDGYYGYNTTKSRTIYNPKRWTLEHDKTDSHGFRLSRVHAIDDHFNHFYNFKVIGNIYQNPELLEV